jgi:hypothetical protein
MNRLSIPLVLAFVVLACAGSPARTGWEAEHNRANLLKLNLGMTKEQVINAMGDPYKTEMYQIDGKPIEFWFFLTEGRSIRDQGISDINFTPLAFSNGILQGWGRNYYDNELKIRKQIIIEKK